MTFGTPPARQRSFAPRKGAHALNALMGQLYGVQPTPTHSDYVAAAQDLLRRQRKRALVIVITNFRDEDSSELGQALRLLRSRHLVLLASLRERIVGELIDAAAGQRRRRDRRRQRASLRAVAPRRVQPPRRARRADGRRRAGAPRHRAGQPLPRGEARRADLTTRQRRSGRRSLTTRPAALASGVFGTSSRSASSPRRGSPRLRQ